MRNRTSEKRNQLPRSHGELTVGPEARLQLPEPFPCGLLATEAGASTHLGLWPAPAHSRLSSRPSVAEPSHGQEGVLCCPAHDHGPPLRHSPSAAGRTGAADVHGWRHPPSLVQSWSRFLKSSLQNWSPSLKVEAPVGAALKEEIPSERAVLRTRCG